jgi:hypothetical protein
MTVALPSPKTTLVILLGASEWPFSPEFQASQAFLNSAMGLRAYFFNSSQFRLPTENLLNLFNSNQSSDDMDGEIGLFLERRMGEMKQSGEPARDLVVYFVGHGGFAGNDSDFYLAIRRTRTDNPSASGIRVISLAYTLKEKARYLRRIVILDCCFAGAAFRAFQSGPSQTAILQTVDAFKVQGKGIGVPERGTSLLCSSRHTAPSLISQDGTHTMFSLALLRALSTGDPRRQDSLSLRAIAGLTEDVLSTMPEKSVPRPEVHSPDQIDGDVADVPFFPNPAAQVARDPADVETSPVAEKLPHVIHGQPSKDPPVIGADTRPVTPQAPVPDSIVPHSARVLKRSRASLIAIVLLLALVLSGIGGYVVISHSTGQTATNTPGQRSTPGNSPTATSPTMESLDLQFPYAGERITVTSVQEAARFADDLQPYQGQGLVRITLNETNPSHWHAGFGLFSDVAHLLLSDGSTANVNAVKSDGGLDANASRANNWLDFAVPSAVPDLSKLVLRMGTATEHRMDIPLLPSADLSQYQDKTITPNTPVSYGGLNWTLQSVTLSLSGAKGAQATAGMRYVILSLRVDNPTSHDVVIGFPEDYLRLKSTDATSTPIVDTMTLPGHAPANTTNVTGTVFFLMPEHDTSFTLEWLVSKNPVYDPISDTQVNTPILFP